MILQEKVQKKFTYLEKLFSLPTTSYEDFISFSQQVATHTVGRRKYYIRRVSVKSNKLFFRLYQIDHIGNVQKEFVRYIGPHTAVLFLAKLKKFEYAYARQLP
jgi:hypothetical protein